MGNTATLTAAKMNDSTRIGADIVEQRAERRGEDAADHGADDALRRLERGRARVRCRMSTAVMVTQ
jgi:hypothetical protein